MNELVGIAHPSRLDDSIASLETTLRLYRSQGDWLPQAEFMLSTPCHHLLRTIYGSHLAVLWWALRRAASYYYVVVMPVWWHKWRYRRLYGTDDDVDQLGEEAE